MHNWRLLLLTLLIPVLTGCVYQSVDQEPVDRYTGALSNDCSEDYIVVFAKGSSQPEDLSAQPETRRFFRAIDQIFQKQMKIGYVSLDYPAAGGLESNLEAWGNGATSGSYYDSRVAGSNAAVTLLNDRTTQCDAIESPDARQRYIVGGYSQGAHVVREALFSLSAATKSRIYYVALFGDPTFQGGSAIDTGRYGKDIEGVYGGPDAQVPSDLVSLSQSYCDAMDFFCNGGTTIGGLVTGQARDWMLKVVGQQSAHALYPYDEMYLAAAGYLKQREVLGMRLGVDMDVGDFAGSYEGFASCDWSGAVFYSTASTSYVLNVEVASDGVQMGNVDRTENLSATAVYSLINDEGNDAREVGRAVLTGTGSEGVVSFNHVRWAEGGDGIKPMNSIVLDAEFTLLESGVAIAAAKKLARLSTAFEGHEGCYYSLQAIK